MSGRPDRRERALLVKSKRRPPLEPSTWGGQRAAPVKGCPRPTKAAFADQTEAACEALKISRKTGRVLVPYSCACGRWHLSGQDRWRAAPNRNA